MWKICLYFSFIILFHVSFLSATNEKKSDEELIQQMLKVMNDCNETFKVDLAYIESLKENGSLPDETDKMPKCYVRCALMGMDILSDDDKFQPAQAAVIYHVINKEADIKEVQEVAISCSDRNEKCKCERAFQYLKCIKETMLKRTKKS